MTGAHKALSEDPAYLSEQLVTCIGNKRALLEFIGRGIDHVRAELGRDRVDVLDAFAGSGAVSRNLKRVSRRLIVNDLEPWSVAFNTCYLANARDVDRTELERTIDAVRARAAAEPRPGFIAELYAPDDDEHIRLGERVFYTRDNAVTIDTVRTLIDEMVPERLRPFVLGPLLWQASVHANTSGVFKGFYKNSRTGVGQFGGNGRDALTRICAPIALQPPVLSRFEADVELRCGDINAQLDALDPVDVAYLDPPYNQHPYGSNYFMLNLIADYRRPAQISRVSGIPNDWRRSDYNRRPRAAAALRELVHGVRAKFVLVSFNSEGFIAPDEMRAMLEEAGPTAVFEQRYNTFRGSRNLRQRSRYVSELLFVVDKRGV